MCCGGAHRPRRGGFLQLGLPLAAAAAYGGTNLRWSARLDGKHLDGWTCQPLAAAAAYGGHSPVAKIKSLQAI